MPPRKKSKTKTKKSTPNSEQSDVELSLVVDRNETISESENKIEDSAAAEEDCSANEGGSELAEIAGEEINANAIEIEGLPIVAVEMKVEETVVDQKNVMEVKVEEEGVNVEGVMGDHTESLIRQCGAEEDGERIEGENDNSQMEDEKDKGDNEAVEKGVEGEENEGRDVGIGDTQFGITVSVADKNSFEEGTAATQICDFEALGNNDNVLILNEGSNEERGDVGGGKDEKDIRDIEEENEVENEDEYPSEFIDNHITDRKKENDLELFIGNLDKGAVEDDLIKVFGKFGEIRATRVVRNSITNNSRGFAFIQYATAEQAKNALSSLKGGIQVRGKRAKISASQDNDTVYMGNICKLWTKDRVLETLKSYGIENIEEIHLPDDPKKEGKIKGFALLQFSTHSDALAAFQRLRKPDAVFGRDISAKVAFAQTPMHPTAEILSQVKTVYVEGLTDSWNNEKIKEVCKQYGEIVKVKLSRKLNTKRNDFGFITFTSSESALACVDGINNADIGEGEVKVKASIAKPIKGRLQQVARGGFKVKKKSTVPSTKEQSEKENKGQASKMKGCTESKQVKKKGKIEAEEKGKAVAEPEIGRDIPIKPQTVIESQHIQSSSKLESKNRKRKNRHSKADGHEKIGAEHGHNEKPSKKPQSNVRAKQSNKYKKPRRDPHIRKGLNYGADFGRSRNPYTLGFAASTVSFQGHAYSTVSGSKRPCADMEPHAGYIEPVSRKQGRSYSGHLESPVGMQYKPHVGYVESTVGIQNQPHTRYHEPAVGKQGRPHAGYLEPSLGKHGQPHAGYIEPAVRGQGPSHVGYFESAVGKHSHSPYGLVPRRVDGQDLHGSCYSAYGAGSSLQPSYVPNYTGYAGYENRSSVGSRYQSSGTHLPRRSYY